MKKTKLFNGSIIALLVAMLLTTSLAVAQTTTDGLKVTKTVTPDPNVPFQYNVTLEAWSTGSTGQKTVTTTKPAHIVMILDNGYQIEGTMPSGTSALTKMKELAKSVLDNLKASPSATTNSHKVSIISCNYPDNTDTKVLKTNVSIDANTNLNDLKGAIDGITKNEYGCGLGKAIEKAQNEFNSSTDYQKIIIFFSGTLAGDLKNSNTTYLPKLDKVAAAYVTAASAIKNNVKIFTIGLYPSNSYNDYDGGGYGTKNYCTSAMREYLKAVSSDYPNASASSTSNGTIITLNAPISSTKYYQDGSTSSSNVNLSVDYLLESTTTSTTEDKPDYTFADASISDVIPTPWSAPTSATVKIAKWDGSKFIAPESADISASISGNTVSVSDFDFNANYVGNHVVSGSSTAAGGYKLIVTYPIKLNVAGLTSASTSVLVNEANAGGLYDGYTLQKGFSATSVPLYTIEISRTGLNIGESATFTVYKVNGSVETPVGQVVTTCTTKDVAATATLKVPEAGTYLVRETTWGYTYNQSNYKQLNCNAAGKFSCSFSGEAQPNDALHSETHKTY